jgi:putative nucleotidyltransferase with HDIG domain
MNHHQLPAMRRFVEVLALERRDLERRLLRENDGADMRSMRTRLFADAFLRTLDDAVECGEATMFERWLRECTSKPGALRPPVRVASAMPRALEHAAREHQFYEQARTFIAEIERTMQDAFAAGPSIHAPVDEVDAAIDKVLAELDSSDPLTAEHSRAVGAWCTRIAHVLGMNDRETREMTRAGMVHDVGKISLPRTLLVAPRGLDEAEWVIMRSHTVRGLEFARMHHVLMPYRDAIVSHHERLDGTGYPHGLRGDAIPFQARVVAVADSFNAMIGRRPYRPAFLPDEALSELQAGAGTQFDPSIVWALERIVNV